MRKGQKNSEETKRKMSLAKIGKPSNSKGVKRTLETRKKMSLSHIGKRPSNFEQFMKTAGIKGESNPSWKGEEAGYRVKHHWIRKICGSPEKCKLCDKEKTTPKSIHWANISRLYKREISDWVSLCAKCHKGYDMGKIILASKLLKI